MEYMSRLLQRMQQNHNFNHHSRCAKLALTHLTFADDILLFARGEKSSVDMMMKTMHTFYNSTGLGVNTSKCNVYFGDVSEEEKQNILVSTGFNEGQLPFRYLGVPLTSKKMSLNHYLPLIERILNKIHHWSAKLLSMAGRIQLVKSVCTAIASYWLQCFPIPKCVIHKIHFVCHTFIWTGGETNSSKSPVAWDTVCKPIKHGGLGIIHLEMWNQVTMLKLLWNLSKKQDCLWVKWMHSYFIKEQNLMNIEVTMGASWIIKGVMKARNRINDILSYWNSSITSQKFSLGSAYKVLYSDNNFVAWYDLIAGNMARPRAVTYLWLTCHRRMATKDRLAKWGIIGDVQCCLCHEIENIDHLFFECSKLNQIWRDVLSWLCVDYLPSPWNVELQWLITYCSGKGKKAWIMKIAIAETIYHCWLFRNVVCFGNRIDRNTTDIVNNIIEAIIHRSWHSRRYREYTAHLMLHT
ncbi:uncharacterized protein LOC131643698 [Vicia villosa]|uniref:uncharacterized protein LOC131643698 n=1 Tax=Vicia villosa TaxID=3911 RepID=UPI00273C5BA7|nr:uncharacterized protein LOC131643698 [Vicia villosa]